MKTIISYHFDEEKEMIYFSNGHQSSVTSCGQFIWNKRFYKEDMIELSKDTGFVFVKDIQTIMKHLKEFKSIAGLNNEPNQELNKAAAGEGEDPRLLKIRQFKGCVKDYKSYWEDRIKNQ